MGKNKYVDSPEKLWELFLEYKNNNEEISIDGFQLFCKKTIGDIKTYFYKSSYANYQDVIQKIKDNIFDFKLELYNSGKLKPQKIVRDAKSRGIKLKKAKFFKEITNADVNQFEIQDGLLTISDTFLKKKNASANHKMNKTIPDTLYVLNISGTNIYKIGITQNYKRRIHDIRSVIPFSVDVVLLKKCLLPFELEQSIHEYYKDYHIKNEWFKINNVKELLDKINR
jgi:hypothetical protein